MTEEQSNHPAAEKAEVGRPASTPGRLAVLVRFIRRKVVSFFFNWLAIAAATLISIVVYKLVDEYILPQQATLIEFQAQLVAATRNLNPAALLDYVFEWTVHLFEPVRYLRDGLFTAMGSFRNWVLSLISDHVSTQMVPVASLVVAIVLLPVVIVVLMLTLLALFGYLFVALLLSPLTLTFGVITKGNVLEAVLVLLIFLPSLGFLWKCVRAAAFSDLSLTMRAGFFYAGVMLALLMTTAFYFVTHMAMVATMWGIGKLVPAAPTVVAGSAIGAFCYECTVKTVEGGFTDSLAGGLKRAAKALIRAGRSYLGKPGPEEGNPR